MFFNVSHKLQVFAKVFTWIGIVAGALLVLLGIFWGAVTDEVRRLALGADAAVIEANHDVVMLRSGPYPYHLKRRIMSDRGHLSNEACACFASELVRSGTKKLLLAHLSRENNTPAFALKTVSDGLREAGVSAETEAAPWDTVSGVYII